MSNDPSVDTAEEATTDASRPEILRLEGISKRFGRVVAVEDVSLSVYENEIFGLVGDNGAGKSTLLNVLSGVHKPTSGTLSFEGDVVSFENPSDARRTGIETVYQDLALMDDLDIASNLYIGGFPKQIEHGPISVIDWDATYEGAEEILEYLNQDVDPQTEVQFLSGGQRQLVAVGRSLLFDPSVLILDEPTSALSVAGTELVHDTMERLRAEGHTIIVVSHNLDDIYHLADRIGVMYQGRLVDVVDPSSADRDALRNLVTTGQRNPDRSN